jgi:hypothetical protein
MGFSRSFHIEAQLTPAQLQFSQHLKTDVQADLWPSQHESATGWATTPEPVSQRQFLKTPALAMGRRLLIQLAGRTVKVSRIDCHPLRPDSLGRPLKSRLYAHPSHLLLLCFCAFPLPGV